MSNAMQGHALVDDSSSFPKSMGKPRWRLRLVRIFWRTSSVLLAGLLLTVLVTQVLRSRPLVLPPLPGPSAVGRTFYDWIDGTRRDPFAPAPGHARELLVWVWYPTDPHPHLATAPYFPPKWAETIDGNWVQSALVQRLSSIKTHSYADVPVATGSERYPVVILLPGLGRAPGEYATVAESVASQGNVVVGITPTYSTSTVVFPDGRTVTATPAASDAADLAQLVTVWADDVHFILGQLAGLHNGLMGRLDLSRVGMLGHSIGGATAAEACRREPNCRGAIDMDGTPYGPVLQTGVPHPLLLILGEQNQQPQGASEFHDIEALYQRSTPPSYQLLVHGMRHDNFLDESLGFAPILKIAGGLGTIDARRGLAITTTYILAFFATYLHGETNALLRGPSATYPEGDFASR